MPFQLLLEERCTVLRKSHNQPKPNRKKNRFLQRESMPTYVGWKNHENRVLRNNQWDKYVGGFNSAQDKRQKPSAQFGGLLYTKPQQNNFMAPFDGVTDHLRNLAEPRDDIFENNSLLKCCTFQYFEETMRITETTRTTI